MDTQPNGWRARTDARLDTFEKSCHERYSETKALARAIRAHEREVEKRLTAIDIQIAVLKVKSAMYGVLAGMVGTTIATVLIRQLLS